MKKVVKKRFLWIGGILGVVGIVAFLALYVLLLGFLTFIRGLGPYPN